VCERAVRGRGAAACGQDEDEQEGRAHGASHSGCGTAGGQGV
jgi:hypothetical protein